MIVIILQFVLAVALLAGAAHLLVSLNRQRSKEWAEIMEGIARNDGDLSQLSYGSIFSDGLDCPTDEVWSRINGRRGLWAIYRNAGVILEAVEYLQSISVDIPSFQRTLQQLREEGKRLRIALLAAYLTHLLTFPMKRSSPPVGRVVKAYLALIAGMSLAVSDYAPDLLIQYRYFVSQS